MLRLAKAFWDIALLRRSPAQLPASWFLLALVAGSAALLEIVGALLPPASLEHIVMRVVLSVGAPLAFAAAVLLAARQPARFRQTASALLGVGVLIGLVLYPASSMLSYIGQDRLAALPLGVLMLAGFIWYLIACANIWRAALDSGLGLGMVLSAAYLLLSLVLEQRLLPDA